MGVYGSVWECTGVLGSLRERSATFRPPYLAHIVLQHLATQQALRAPRGQREALAAEPPACNCSICTAGLAHGRLELGAIALERPGAPGLVLSRTSVDTQTHAERRAWEINCTDLSFLRFGVAMWRVECGVWWCGGWSVVRGVWRVEICMCVCVCVYVCIVCMFNVCSMVVNQSEGNSVSKSRRRCILFII
jgi:hypothetical protein